jgi:cell division protein ZapA
VSSEPSARVVSVEIQGQRYAIRSTLDAAYVAELAAYVDAKLNAATEATPTGDSIKVAVLAALNIADEFFRARQHERSRTGRLLERAEELERLVDSALARVET